MNKAITFIINPAAGFGRTGRRERKVSEEITRYCAQAQIVITKHPMHATAIARDAIKSGSERIVVIGGDGTLNEVVNGFFDSAGELWNKDASLAIISSGTGSDFARNFSFSLSDDAALHRAIFASPTLTDVGLVEAHDIRGGRVKRYFINVAGLGLSASVVSIANGMAKKLWGPATYFLATLQALANFTPSTLIFRDDDGMESTVENCSLVAFANGKYCGHGMKIAPKALLDDGLLDKIIIKDIGFGFFLLNGHRVYTGEHIKLENVSMKKVKSCFVKTIGRPKVFVETDGELFAELPAKISIFSEILKVVR